MSVQRYTTVGIPAKSPNGEWVWFEHHEAIVKELEADRDAARANFLTMQGTAAKLVKEIEHLRTQRDQIAADMRERLSHVKQATDGTFRVGTSGFNKLEDALHAALALTDKETGDD